jgi:hypothetical protein
MIIKPQPELSKKNTSLYVVWRCVSTVFGNVLKVCFAWNGIKLMYFFSVFCSFDVLMLKIKKKYLKTIIHFWKTPCIFWYV